MRKHKSNQVANVQHRPKKSTRSGRYSRNPPIYGDFIASVQCSHGRNGSFPRRPRAQEGCTFPPPDLPHIAVLHNDEIAIGRKGAAFLCGKGKFRSFAYVPDGTKSWWSTYRQRGFRLELARRGQQCRTFRSEKAQLTDWLSSLEKPAAIMTTNDVTGTRVIEACRTVGIDIPEQVAVLGVDNDEIVCNGIRPTLSSLHPNHVELARRAAEELDRIMHGRRKTTTPILIPPLGIVERASTETIPPAGFLIKSALAYISTHATDGITASDVARHLKISHSLLRLRFRTIYGKSVRDQILDVRFSAVNNLLKTTDYPLEHISARTGFSSANLLSHAYKDRFGYSPSDFRRRQASSTLGTSDSGRRASLHRPKPDVRPLSTTTSFRGFTIESAS